MIVSTPPLVPIGLWTVKELAMGPVSKGLGCPVAEDGSCMEQEKRCRHVLAKWLSGAQIVHFNFVDAAAQQAKILKAWSFILNHNII